MKAMLCKELGHPSKLVLEEIASPKPGVNDVKIKIKACSVNYPDTLIVQGLYQYKPELPFAPGSDISGIVAELGTEVKSHKQGDEVFGIAPYGGFAEEIVLPAKSIFPKPPSMSHQVAASFTMAYGTSYHALKDRAQLKAGESILILGAAGGVGLAAIELAKQMGAFVIAAASTDEKLAVCKSKGADETINYSKEDLKVRTKELTGGNGVDVVYDSVGGDKTEQALRATGWKGRVLIVGFPGGIANIPMNLPLLKGCQIVGVFFGAFVAKEPQKMMVNTLELIQMHGEGKLKPHIDAVYSLEDSRQALVDLMERRVKGKIIIEP